LAAAAAALELAYLNCLAVAIEAAAVAASVAVVVVYFEMNCCEPFDLRIDNFAYGRCVYVDLDVDHDCHVFVCRLRFELHFFVIDKNYSRISFKGNLKI